MQVHMQQSQTLQSQMPRTQTPQTQTQRGMWQRGLRGQRIGEATHPGPECPGCGDTMRKTRTVSSCAICHERGRWLECEACASTMCADCLGGAETAARSTQQSQTQQSQTPQMQRQQSQAPQMQTQQSQTPQSQTPQLQTPQVQTQTQQSQTQQHPAAADHHVAHMPAIDIAAQTQGILTPKACSEWKRTSTKKSRLCTLCDQDLLKQTLYRCEAQLREGPRRPMHTQSALRTWEF